MHQRLRGGLAGKAASPPARQPRPDHKRPPWASAGRLDHVPPAFRCSGPNSEPIIPSPFVCLLHKRLYGRCVPLHFLSHSPLTFLKFALPTQWGRIPSVIPGATSRWQAHPADSTGEDRRCLSPFRVMSSLSRWNLRDSEAASFRPRAAGSFCNWLCPPLFHPLPSPLSLGLRAWSLIQGLCQGGDRHNFANRKFADPRLAGEVR